IWQEGQKGKGSGTIDENKSELNRRMPFQHAAVSKLIYAFWLNGPTRAEVKVRQEKFSSVPDNLVALVCNALEAAIKDHLHASANNALNLQFLNKIYAPKWDDLMTLLEEIHNLSPAGYASMKSLIWARVRQVLGRVAKIKEDEKVRGLDEEGALSNPKNDIPFDDLAVDEVQVEDDVDTEGEHDELESHKEGPSGAVKSGAAVGDQGKEGTRESPVEVEGQEPMSTMTPASSSQGTTAQAIDLGDLAGSPKSASANKELVGNGMVSQVIEGAASSNNPGDKEGTL
ncbi:hypothetical protein FOMPIDRAFT_1045443, partial [Fomitopsis schrenkii]